MNKIFTLLLFYVFVNAHAQVVLRIKSLPENTPLKARFSIICEQNNWNASDSNFLFNKVKNDWVLKLPNLSDTFFYKITRFSNNKIEVDAGFKEIENRMVLPSEKGIVNVNIFNWSDFKKHHSDNSNVEILSDSFYSEFLGSARKIWIYLPNDYYTDKQKKFPIIYALQGQNLFDNYTADNTEWRIDETLKSMQYKNDNGCIVVGIEGLKNEADRETDLFYKGFGANDTSLAKYVGLFINYELRPYIDSTYKTKINGDYFAIIGAGKYAQLALTIGLKYPYSFSKIGLFSPIFSHQDSLYNFIENNKRKRPTRVYITVGYNDSIAKPETSEKLQSFLLEKADFFDSEVNLETKLKGVHDETFWTTMFKPCYLWLFESMNHNIPVRYIKYNNNRSDMIAKVYPNPAKVNITIETDANLIRILTENGDLMEEIKGTPPSYLLEKKYLIINQKEKRTYQIDLSKYKPGNYYVVFTENSFGNNSSISRTLIVQ